MSEKDGVLSTFVNAANNHEFELDITLVTGGAVVTGTLVSAEEYFKELSESFEGGNDVSEELGERFKQTSESASGGEGEAQFIHMKKTKVYLGDSKPTPSKGDILWRGKLSEVDSFFLGKISEPKSNSSSKKSSS